MNYIQAFRRIAVAALFSLSIAAQTQTAAGPELKVIGDIPAPLTLKADDLARMPRETVLIPDPDGTKVNYEGVALREVLRRAGIPLGSDLRETVVIADKRDGKPLAGNQGPLRLVCPNDKAGARSVRMLERLDVVRLQK
jgi:DMSO/TMAO reductase YedYZ molybdopterin-dependent catalytic subunit